MTNIQSCLYSVSTLYKTFMLFNFVRHSNTEIITKQSRRQKSEVKEYRYRYKYMLLPSRDNGIWILYFIGNCFDHIHVKNYACS